MKAKSLGFRTTFFFVTILVSNFLVVRKPRREGKILRKDLVGKPALTGF